MCCLFSTVKFAEFASKAPVFPWTKMPVQQILFFGQGCTFEAIKIHHLSNRAFNVGCFWAGKIMRSALLICLDP